MNVSGALGYTLLQSKNSQFILVLSDVDDGVSYCELGNNNIKISKKTI